MTIFDLYHHAACNPSSIHEHIPTLLHLARMVDHITEFGTQLCASTAAFVRGEPKKLVTYDIMRHPTVDVIEAATKEHGVTEFVFKQEDTRTCVIEETDLLFIDTWHTYQQLLCELDRNGPKVRKFIAMHDTVSFGHYNEDKSVSAAGKNGLWPAIEEYFLSTEGRKEWKIIEHWPNNNGLTLFMRRSV